MACDRYSFVCRSMGNLIGSRLLRLRMQLSSAPVFEGPFQPWDDMERKEDRVVLQPAQRG